VQELRHISVSAKHKVSATYQLEESRREADVSDEILNDQERKDTRRVQCNISDNDSVGSPKRPRVADRLSSRARQIKQEAVEAASPDVYQDVDQMGDPEDDNDDSEDEAELRKILIQQKQSKMKRINPKFVVTLDSVYQRSIDDQDDNDDNDLDLPLSTRSISPSPVGIPRNVVRVKPQFVHSQARTESGDKGFDQEMDQFKTSEPDVQKSSERCRFWPVCKSGDACLFHHPIVTCKTFPSCRFGDKCLYIHPTCKFDGKCTKPSCPYTHVAPRPNQAITASYVHQARNVSHHTAAVKAPALAARPVKPVKCKFFPNCSDMSCAFAHPKPCRYGVSCTSKVICPFSHPVLSAKSQFKWTPGQQ
jgi:hypothetical protein